LPELPTSADRARYVREMFGAISPRYDFLNHFLSGGLDRQWRRRAARACLEAVCAPSALAPGARICETHAPGARAPSVSSGARTPADEHPCERESNPDLTVGARTGKTLAPGARTHGVLVLDLCCGTGDLALALLAQGAAHVAACDFSRPMLARAAAKFARKGVAGRTTLVEADAMALPLPAASVDAVTCGFGLRNMADPVRGLAEMVRVVRPGGAVVLLEFFPPRERGLLAAAFRLYFRRILPRLGACIAGGDRGGYQYLVDSVAAFRTPAELAAAMERAGLDGVRIEPLIGGIASVYVGSKQ